MVWGRWLDDIEDCGNSREIVVQMLPYRSLKLLG